MSRTITALFDSRSEAEVAKARLQTADIDVSSLSIADESSQGYDASRTRASGPR